MIIILNNNEYLHKYYLKFIVIKEFRLYKN